MTDVANNVLKQYENDWQRHFGAEQNSILINYRKNNLDAFLESGFPSLKEEQWKYTNITPIKTNFFPLNKNININDIKIDDYLLAGDHFRLVFVNGYFVQSLSLLPGAHDCIVTNLATALNEYPDLVHAHLPRQRGVNGFINLNAAAMTDGAFVYLPENCQLETPLQLIFLATEENSINNIRNLIILEANAKLTLFEQHVSQNNAAYFTNVNTQFFADMGANAEYVKLQMQHKNSFHISNIEFQQAQNSHISANYYHLGSQLAREDAVFYLSGEQAINTQHGLYFPSQEQHIDIHTYVYHESSHTQSDAKVRGVAGGKSRAVFNGKIKVEKNVEKVIANLQNKNLLLAATAEINAKPELEIYADDIKCQHGATIGTLDKEMLFYLRSRGIKKAEAHQLLLLAFVKEQLSAIVNESIANQLQLTVTNYCEEVAHE